MRAAVLETPGRPLALHDDVVLAEPGLGQVQVRIAACGVCHSDLSLADGTFPAALPIVLGHEASGVVEAIGPGVVDLAPGDPVVLTPCPPCGSCYWCVRGEPTHCSHATGIQTNTFPDGSTGLSRAGQTVYRGLNLGAFAECVLAPASAAVKVPVEVPLDVACVIGCAVQTGVGSVLNTAGVEEGASVLVMGLGGVGLSVVQGARIAGASRILASDPLPERRTAAKHFGATDLLDPGREDVGERVREITSVGVDYAFETAGRAALIQTGLAACRTGGTTVCVGAPPLDEKIEVVPASLFVITGKRLVASVLGGCHARREIPRLIGLWQAGRLDLEGLVTARRPLAEADQALADLAAGRGIRSVLTP